MSYKADKKVTGDQSGGTVMSGEINCESCANFMYDEEFEEYYCQMNLDEDEYGKLLGNSRYRCPYFQFQDEYKVVRKQM